MSDRSEVIPKRRPAAPTIPRELLEAAREAARYAYAPYSGFAVGVAAETDDGRIYLGANMENASYGLTSCAEVGAIQAASTAGDLGKIVRMAVVGGPIEPSTAHRNQPTPPCGRCRQVIAESAALGKRDIEVWFADRDLTAIERRTSSQLLPDSFDAQNLE